ncbi:LptF/LptG family permease, partial [Cribrihabitans sp. XS_ASV171]
MILDRYFARLFLQSFLVIAGIFLSLILLIDLIEQVRRFEGLGLGFGQIFRLTLLNAPAAMSEILPLLMILATIILFVGLARSSELVATRAIGRSGIRALAAPVVVALTIGILAVAMLNPIVAATSEHYQRLSDSYRNGGASVLSLSGEGLWLRQGSPSGGQSVIHATGFGGEGGVTLYNVTILTFARDGGPVRQIFADSAELAPRTWILTNAKVWPLVAGINPESNAALHETLEIPTTLTQD